MTFDSVMASVVVSQGFWCVSWCVHRIAGIRKYLQGPAIGNQSIFNEVLTRMLLLCGEPDLRRWLAVNKLQFQWFTVNVTIATTMRIEPLTSMYSAVYFVMASHYKIFIYVRANFYTVSVFVSVIRQLFCRFIYF